MKNGKGNIRDREKKMDQRLGEENKMDHREEILYRSYIDQKTVKLDHNITQI